MGSHLLLLFFPMGASIVTVVPLIGARFRQQSIAFTGPDAHDISFTGPQKQSIAFTGPVAQDIAQ